MKQILVVEDSPADIELMQEALADVGVPHEIVLLRDGAQALDYCEAGGQFSHRAQSIPDVIFLDLKLPLVDGFTVLARLKRDAVMRFVPVVVFSGSWEHADITRSYALGANGYVVKQAREFRDNVQNLARYWCLANTTARVSL